MDLYKTAEALIGSVAITFALEFQLPMNVLSYNEHDISAQKSMIKLKVQSINIF